jgi:CBS domain-containing protein
LAGSRTELLVVDSEDRLLGTVSLGDVRAVLPQSDLLASLAVAADAVHETVPFVLPTDNLDLVMHLFGRTHRDELPVCADSSSRQIVGIITRHAVIDAYNRRVFHHDLAGGFGSLIEAVRGRRSVDVLAGITLSEIEVPFSLVGRTLAELDLRRRFAVEVVLIHASNDAQSGIEGRPGKLPTPNVRLEAGDRLLVMGAPDAVNRLQEGLVESVS